MMGGLVEGRNMMRIFLAEALNGRSYALAANAFDGRFAGGIDVEHQNSVGVGEGGAEFFQEVAGAGVTVRLEDHVNPVEAALAGSREGGANLGGMVSVIINHADVGHAALELKPAVYSA